jgi:geranylgeranylglycerol-phosphate geranylgeranyltransferase
VGHLVVGGVVALGVLYGAMVAREAGVGAAPGGMGLAPWGAVLTLVLVAAREVVKAIPDVEGDRAEGARTLPVVLGPRRAAWLALVTVGAAVAALPAFPLLGFDPLFLAWSVPMGACLLAAVWALLAADARARLRPGAAAWRAGAVRASAWMKAAMALAVLALALGR